MTSQESPGPAPVAAFDGPAARRWVALAHSALGRERAGIDALNVYPVADADTGTNLHLTLDAGARSVLALPADAGLRTVLRALADGSLRGARGSSGAILAQFLRGLQPVPGRPVPAVAAGTALGQALVRGAASAREAVPRPVEGTMLSVAAAAGTAAVTAGADLSVTARAAAAAAREALERTPGQLDVLREAGVVDAGGRGLTVLYDALAAVVTGQPMASGQPIQRRHHAHVHAVSAGASVGQVGQVNQAGGAQVEVTYLLLAGAEHAQRLAAVLDRLGEDVVVGRGDGLLSVHVHLGVDDVEEAARAGRAVGQVLDLRVTPLVPGGVTELRSTTPTLAVLAAGDGVAGLAAAAGATVVRTAAGLGELLRAPYPAGLIVLPSGGAALATALAARERLSPAERARVEVIACDAAPAALAALAVHDPALALHDAAAVLDAAVGRVRPGRVTLDGRTARGSALGVPVSDGTDALRVASEVVSRVAGEQAELLTLVPGAGHEGLADSLAAALRRSRPGLEVVVHPGGQPDEILAMGAE